MGNDVFNHMAQQYDTKDRCELARIIVDAIQLELGESKNKSLLDYGSGTGLVGLELSPFVKNLVLVDSSAHMVNVVEEKIQRRHITNATVMNADFTQSLIPIRVDILIVSLVLLHIRDTQQILRQFFSVLHHDGKLIIVDFDENEQISHPNVHNGFSQMKLQHLLSDVGFRDIRIKTFYHGKNIFMNQDASLLIATSIK